MQASRTSPSDTVADQEQVVASARPPLSPSHDVTRGAGRDMAGNGGNVGRRARRARASQFYLGLLVATILFGGLAFLARSTPYWAVDLTVARAIQSIDLPGFETALGVISWIGFPPQFAVLCALTVVALFLARRVRDAMLLLLTMVGAGALWFTSTRLIDRPRPDAALVRVTGEIAGGSFPSGHVLTILAIFGFVVYLAYTRPTPTWLRALVPVVFGLPILVVGVARIYAGHHWPSDVLGGYMLGSMWLAIMIHVDRAYGRTGMFGYAATPSDRDWPASGSASGSRPRDAASTTSGDE